MHFPEIYETWSISHGCARDFFAAALQIYRPIAWGNVAFNTQCVKQTLSMERHWQACGSEGERSYQGRLAGIS